MKRQILALILSVISVSNFASAAEFDNSIFPDSSNIALDVTMQGDTISIVIENLSAEPISNFFISALTDFQIDEISHVVDGVTNKMLTVEIENGTVTQNKITTRWVVESFSETVEILFYTDASMNQSYSYCGNQPFPFFGLIQPIPDLCCIGYRGNIDNDAFDTVDIADLVFFVFFAFGSGFPPTCTAEADVDGSGDLDITDIVYLVDYMFDAPSGPAPVVCP